MSEEQQEIRVAYSPFDNFLEDLEDKRRQIRMRRKVIHLTRNQPIRKNELIALMAALPDDAELLYVDSLPEVDSYGLYFGSMSWFPLPDNSETPRILALVHKKEDGSVTVELRD